MIVRHTQLKAYLWLKLPIEANVDEMSLGFVTRWNCGSSTFWEIGLVASNSTKVTEQQAEVTCPQHVTPPIKW